MAFSALGGLGGGGAAGFLGGMQSASDRIAQAKQGKEASAMQMYSKLLQSGEWEPVGKEGSVDGGVLSIRGVGLLKKKKVGVSPLTMSKIATQKALEAKYRRPEKTGYVEKVVSYPNGTSAMLSVPKGQSIALDNGRFGYAPQEKKPSLQLWKDRKTGEFSFAEKGVVPKGKTPYSAGMTVTEKLVLMHQDGVLEDRIRSKTAELKPLMVWEGVEAKGKKFVVAQQEKVLELRREIGELNAQRDAIGVELGDKAGIERRALKSGSPVDRQDSGVGESSEDVGFDDVVKESSTYDDIIRAVEKRVAAITKAMSPGEQPLTKAMKSVKLPTAREKLLAPKTKKVKGKKTPPRPNGRK